MHPTALVPLTAERERLERLTQVLEFEIRERSEKQRRALTLLREVEELLEMQRHLKGAARAARKTSCA